MMHNGRVFKEGTPDEIEADPEVQEIYLGGRPWLTAPQRRPPAVLTSTTCRSTTATAMRCRASISDAASAASLSVVGRNGMGKTTLCNAIMGLDAARSGSIRFDGQELTALHAARHRAALGIGYVPQGRRRLALADGRRAPAARRGGGATRAWTHRAHLRDLPAPGRAAQQRRRAAVGRRAADAGDRAGAAAEPALLVMDEPTEGLAPVIVDQVERDAAAASPPRATWRCW